MFQRKSIDTGLGTTEDSPDPKDPRFTYNRTPWKGQHFCHPKEEFPLARDVRNGTQVLLELRCLWEVPSLERTAQRVTLPSTYTQQISQRALDRLYNRPTSKKQGGPTVYNGHY